MVDYYPPSIKSFRMLLLQLGLFLGILWVSWAKLLVPGLYPSRYEVRGDINLGVFVQVSTQMKSPDQPHCSQLTPGRSSMWMMHIHFCEVVNFAMKQINQRTDLLPNVSLGMVCMDTCDDPLTALARSVYLLKDHLPDTCQTPRETEDAGAPLEAMSLRHHEVAGVIGPFSSEEAVLVSTLLGVFQIPVLGTHSTSDELSNKNNYEYFVGLAPPDRFQANALVDIAVHFNWTYIGLFYSEDSYGEYGYKQVQMLAEKHGLCLAFAFKISTKYIHEEERQVLDLLDTHPNLKALIWFAEGDGLREIFGAIAKKYPIPKAVYLFSYMSGYMRVVYKDATVGSFSVGPFTAGVPGFMDYVTGLIPGNNTHNPWLSLRWQETFNCEWTHASNTSCHDFRADRRWYGYYPIISPYYDATYVYAHALHEVINRHCSQAFHEAEKLRECIKGPDLLKAVKNVSFTGISGMISFNEDGDRLGKYRVSHMYQNQEGVVAMTTVGFWDRLTGILDIHEDQVNLEFLRPQEPDPRSGYTRVAEEGASLFIPYSVCSWPCGPREFRIQRKVACCWECRSCRDNEVVQNTTSCVACPQFTWPDVTQQATCVRIHTTFLQWADPIAMSLACLSVLGMLLTLTFGVVLFRKRSTKLVKASNKELSFLVLVGACLAFAVVFIFIAEPSPESCMLRQLGFHFTVHLLYSPVFVKSCRVYRIFTQGKKGMKRPRFTSSLAQRVMAVVSISGQVIFVSYLC